jgi:septal ring factor EnvC (AmiA/AmiB activator)
MKDHSMLTQIHKFNREFDGKNRQIAQLVQENKQLKKQLQETEERERATNEQLQQASANVSELQRQVHEKDIQLMNAG